MSWKLTDWPTGYVFDRVEADPETNTVTITVKAIVPVSRDRKYTCLRVSMTATQAEVTKAFYEWVHQVAVVG